MSEIRTLSTQEIYRNQWMRLIADGQISDATTVTAFLLAKLKGFL